MASSVFIWPGMFTYDGTDIIFPFPGAFPNGTVAAPGITFTNSLSTGWSMAGGAGSLTMSLNGSDAIFFSTNSFRMNSAALFGFNSTTTPSASGVLDTTLERLAAGSFGMAHSALGTTSTDGLTLYNATAATSGVTVQISPRFRLRGTAWDTAASETLDWFLENLPATAATPTSTLKFGQSVNGGAATYPMTLTNAGALTVLNQVVSSAGVYLRTTTRTNLDAPADGQMVIATNNVGAGVGLDVATDGILKLRTRALTGGAVLDLLEQSAPSGATDIARIYADVTGAKTKLMVIFQSGAAQQIAIEP